VPVHCLRRSQVGAQAAGGIGSPHLMLIGSSPRSTGTRLNSLASCSSWAARQPAISGPAGRRGSMENGPRALISAMPLASARSGGLDADRDDRGHVEVRPGPDYGLEERVRSARTAANPVGMGAGPGCPIALTTDSATRVRQVIDRHDTTWFRIPARPSGRRYRCCHPRSSGCGCTSSWPPPGPW
jgi:hypothetical protein